MPPANSTREANEKIGLALRQARKQAWGVYGSLARTAEMAGVSQGTLSAIERGDHPLSKVRAENLQNFPAAYGMTSQQFAQLTGVTFVIPAAGQSQPENVRITDNLHRMPVRTLAAAGDAFYTDGSIVDYEYVPGDLYRVGMLVVQVVGDSMTPALNDGDYVYVDTRHVDIQEGKIVLSHLHGDGFVLKRVRTVLGQAALTSDNADYGPVLADNADIVGTAYHRQPRGNSL
jgi:phage repressor protein C with HTH and peptisase S24 domain